MSQIKYYRIQQLGGKVQLYNPITRHRIEVDIANQRCSCREYQRYHSCRHLYALAHTNLDRYCRSCGKPLQAPVRYCKSCR